VWDTRLEVLYSLGKFLVNTEYHDIHKISVTLSPSTTSPARFLKLNLHAKTNTN